jgi:MFS family permease
VSPEQRRPSRASSALDRLGVLRDPDFGKLWLATTVSQLGTQITQIAWPLVAILLLHAGPAEMGILVAAETIPFLLIGLPAGVWVDRMRRRPVLIVADVARGVLLASVPVAAFLGALTMIQLYVVGFAVGLFSVFFEISTTSYVPALLDRARLVEGNQKLEAGRAVASVAGPGLAGSLVGLVGAAAAIAVDALSFIVSGLFVAAIRKQEPPLGRASDAPSGMFAEIMSGLRWVFHHPVLRPVLAANTIANVGLSIFQTLVVLYFVQELGVTAPIVGLLFAIAHVGALVGAVLSGPIGRRVGVGPTVGIGLAGEGLMYLLLAITPRESPLPTLIVANALLGLSSLLFHVNALSLRQTVTPHQLLGRMTATYRFASYGVLPLGAFVAGVIGSAVGLRAALLVAAVLGVSAVLPIFLTSVRSLKVAANPDTREAVAG